MYKKLFWILVLIGCVIIVRCQNQTNNRFLIHPNWSENDTQIINTIITVETFNSPDTIKNTFEANQYFIVKEKTENFYNVDWVSEDYDISKILGIEGLIANIDTNLKKVNIPVLEIKIDKWGYPKSISNIDEMRKVMDEFVENLVNSYKSKHKINEDSIKIALSEWREKFLSKKQSEIQLLESINQMFLPYDYWIPNKGEIVDSVEVNLPDFTGSVMMINKTRRENVENNEFVEVNSITQYLSSQENENENWNLDKTIEIKSFRVNKETTKIDWIKIEMIQPMGEQTIRTVVKYKYE